MAARDLDQFLHSQIRGRIERAACALVFKWKGEQAIGSGTFVEHLGQLYVLTCAHVAVPFTRSAAHAHLVLASRGAPNIPARALELRHLHHSDDLALLLVTDPSGVSPAVCPLLLSDFKDVPDMNGLVEAGRSCFVLFGFPANLTGSLPETGLNSVKSLSYLTIPALDVRGSATGG